ncbi:Uma2 family endonuclease [Kyrpidia spormannii]|uniref:Uncharacterized protein n=1 Tax=Kyrpidia spormannii TaxID=2055160 RepID=A0ACA8ZD21_9BACL|nr:Uma2 family endonuclease [Kyrpidia spormannii]CAB3395472.1 conserved protein of unknown function [Kyrpidia spormannii]
MEENGTRHADPHSLRETAERYEVIDGVMYDMTPPPSTLHQRAVVGLTVQLANHFHGTPCQVFAAPFGVWLTENADEHVEPDVLVICNPDIIVEKGAVGPPDLVVEVISPATAAKDKGVKWQLYRRTGVREYWIVDPHHQTVDVWLFHKDPADQPRVYGKNDTLRSMSFENLTIRLSEIFP